MAKDRFFPKKSSKAFSNVSQCNQDGEIPFIPEEIIESILNRVPVKSLIRFQCVCKKWKNLFKTPSFIADHRLHSVYHNPSLLLLSDHIVFPFPMKFCLLDDKKRVREFQNPPLIDSLSPTTKIIGSSNGLLCVEFNEIGMYPPSLLLWNPVIRELRQIPRTIDDFKGDYILGFGFSPIVNDYKIVRAYSFDIAVNRVEVYSLNKGSWKEIGFNKLLGVILFHQYVSTNGTIFWIGRKNVDFIVSFDIAKEVFRSITMPIVHPYATKVLTSYDNKLAMFVDITGRGDPKSYYNQLWVMEDGTGTSKRRWSWTIRYSRLRCPELRSPIIWGDKVVYKCDIKTMPTIRKFLGFKLISRYEHEAENDEPKVVILLSNVNTDEFKIFAICKSDPLLPSFNHVESLTPIDNTH